MSGFDPLNFWRRDVRSEIVVFTSMYVVQLAFMGLAMGAWTIAVTLLSGRSPEVPLTGTPWDYVFVGGLFGCATAGYLLGAYCFLRYARGRYNDRTVYEWLTFGPRVPVLTDMLSRMYERVYRPPAPGSC